VRFPQTVMFFIQLRYLTHGIFKGFKNLFYDEQ
jgi:hypothetical protein